MGLCRCTNQVHPVDTRGVFDTAQQTHTAGTNSSGVPA